MVCIITQLGILFKNYFQICLLLPDICLQNFHLKVRFLIFFLVALLGFTMNQNNFNTMFSYARTMCLKIQSQIVVFLTPELMHAICCVKFMSNFSFISDYRNILLSGDDHVIASSRLISFFSHPDKSPLGFIMATLRPCMPLYVIDISNSKIWVRDEASFIAPHLSVRCSEVWT